MDEDKQKAMLAEIHATGLTRAGETMVLMLVVRELLERLPPGDVAEIRGLANQRLQIVDASAPMGAIIRDGAAEAIKGIFT